MSQQTSVLSRAGGLLCVLCTIISVPMTASRGTAAQVDRRTLRLLPAQSSPLQHTKTSPEVIKPKRPRVQERVADTVAKSSLLSGSNFAAGGGCDSECDWCWCGTEFENYCPTDWFYDADCDCGCQFCDLACFDCSVQDCVGGPCGASCDYCYYGTEFENNCPLDWCGTSDGCDCGCQFTDADCPGGTCGCSPVCADGVCECECGETLETCPSDCMNVPCADVGAIDLGIGAEYGRNGEMCVETFVFCPCAPSCDYCNEGDCDPAWYGDGECDCGCQFCDIDCPEFPDCCISGPAPAEVCARVFPPNIASVSCLVPPTCNGVDPTCGESVLNPVTGSYEFCPIYTSTDSGEACVRLWIDWPDTSCDPELWWRFNQVCGCGNGLCEANCSENCGTCPGDCGGCTGACCLASGACGDDFHESSCSSLGGVYMGDGTICDSRVFTCPAPCTVLSSFPPNCAIDARYPTDSGGTTPAPWDAVELTFNGACNVGALGPDDFVSTLPIGAVAADGSVVTVHWAGVIPAGEWTCIGHTASNTTVCIGALPGDVGSDRTSNAADVLELIDHLNGTRPPPPLEIWQCDVDRSTVCNPADVLGVIDMLNGGWNNRSLPICPAGH